MELTPIPDIYIYIYVCMYLYRQSFFDDLYIIQEVVFWLAYSLCFLYISFYQYNALRVRMTLHYTQGTTM